MSATLSMLACGSLHFSPAEDAMIYSIIAGWLITFGLIFVNLCFIIVMNGSTAAKTMHSGAYCLYTLAGIALVCGVFGGVAARWMFFAIVVIPICACLHFAYLIYSQLRIRRLAKRGGSETTRDTTTA